MNRTSWSPEDREEYEAAMEEAFEAGAATSERIDALEGILADAARAHRPWARDVEREAIRAGLNRLMVEHGKRRQIEELLELHPDAMTVADALHLQDCSLDEWLAGEVSA